MGKWVADGLQLNPAGKVVKTNGVITDGPYTETKEVLMSFCRIKAESIEEAAELSKECPVLSTGGNVEIRELWFIKPKVKISLTNIIGVNKHMN